MLSLMLERAKQPRHKTSKGSPLPAFHLHALQPEANCY